MVRILKCSRNNGCILKMQGRASRKSSHQITFKG